MTRYPDKPRSRVVLIGTGRYDLPDRLPNLRAVRNNLTRLEQVLTDPQTGVFDGEYCEPVDSPHSPRAFMEALTRATRQAEDILLVYYAGHGVLGWHGQLHLAVGGTNPDQLDGTAVPFEWVKHAIQESPARVRVLILDCCFSGRAIMAAESAALEQIDVGGTFILTSTTANRVSHALPGERYTAFTGELLHLLDERARTAGPPLTLGGVREPLIAAMARRNLPPPECRVDNAAGELILCRRATATPPFPRTPSEPSEQLLGPYQTPWQARARAILRGQRRMALYVLVVTLFTSVLAFAGDLPASCASPMELRVLASLGSEPAIQGAAEEFEADATLGGCRQYHVTVYQATTSAVLQAFGKADEWAGGQAPVTTVSVGPRNDAGATRYPVNCVTTGATTPSAGNSAPPGGNKPASGCIVPARDVGPQPDAWFPDSTVDVDRARAVIREGAVVLGAPTSVATSPLVLAVPSAVADKFADKFGDQQRLVGWPELHEAVRTAGVDMVRPSPVTSTSGLLQTVALYQDIASRSGTPTVALSTALDSEAADKGIREVERSVEKPQYPLGDNNSLLCRLARQPRTVALPAVLVSEKAVVDYNFHRLPESGCGDQEPLPATKLRAFYPKDTPSLNHPFVEIDWPGRADDWQGRAVERHRVAAVRQFRDWLLGAKGQQVLARAGYRTGTPPDEKSPLRQAGSGAWVGAPAATPTPAQDVVDTVIKHYRHAHQPGRVLFLLDVSGSMVDEDKLAQGKRAIDQALDLISPGDAVGLMVVPHSTTSPDPAVRVPLGAGFTPAEAQDAVRKALNTVTPVDDGSALYDAIGAALQAMKSSGDADKPVDAGKQVIVVISDGEDRDASGKPLSQLSTEQLKALQPPGAKISVDILALRPAVCASPGLGQVAADSSGQCLDKGFSGQPVNTFVAGVWGGGGV